MQGNDTLLQPAPYKDSSTDCFESFLAKQANLEQNESKIPVCLTTPFLKKTKSGEKREQTTYIYAKNRPKCDNIYPIYANRSLCRQKTNDLPRENKPSNHTKHRICRGRTDDLPKENQCFAHEKGTTRPQKRISALYFNCKHFDTQLTFSNIQKIIRTDGNQPSLGPKQAILSH